MTFDSIDEGIAIYDANFRLVAWNRKYAEMGLAPKDDLKVGYSLIEGYRRAARRRAFAEPGNTEQQADKRITLLLQGKAIPEEELFVDGRIIRIRRSYLDGGGICAVFSDITDEKAIRETLHLQANIDSLTNLPNRGWARNKLSEVLLEASKTDRSTALFFIDLDDFKSINDTFGHDYGDRLFRAVSGRLKSGLSRDQIIARIGGDEFLVALPGATVSTATMVATQLLAVLKPPFEIDGGQVYVSASIGIAMAPADGTDVGTLWRRADTAMYAAKAQGQG
ncbi:MAG: diguanylate cyclase domain-containing protein, partial [Geminicoccaceae bacterium]